MTFCHIKLFISISFFSFHFSPCSVLGFQYTVPKNRYASQCSVRLEWKIERLKKYFRLKNSFMKMYTNKSVLEKRLALLHSRTAHPYDVCDAVRLWMEWLCAIFNLHTCIHNICVVFFVHIHQTSCFVPLADAYVVELYLRFSFLRFVFSSVFTILLHWFVSFARILSNYWKFVIWWGFLYCRCVWSNRIVFFFSLNGFERVNVQHPFSPDF